MAIGDVMNTGTLALTFDGAMNNFVSSADGSTGLWQTTLANGNRSLGSNGEQEYYSDSSVGVDPFSVNNGILDITAAPGSNALGLPYVSGAITTQSSFNQLYGYFQITAELPAGQGLWPAFWLLPISGAWPPELDIFEVLGNNPSTLYFSTHSTTQATQGTALNVANTSAGFNTYGVMWGPQTVDLYINNTEVASMPTPADMNVPMYMLANLAVGGYWPGDPDSSTPFPAHMLIQSIQAYAYPGTTGGAVYDTLPSQNVGPAALAPVISAPATMAAPVGAATALSGISIAANWPGGRFTVVLSESAGQLATAVTADVTTSGENTGTLILTGHLASIDNALATLTYQTTAAGSDWVWITATDPQGLHSSASVVVTATDGAPAITPPSVVAPPVAGIPVVSTPASLSAVAGIAAALNGVGIADNAAGSINVTVSDSSGLLEIAPTTGVITTGLGTTSLHLTGSLAAINADLASLTYSAAAAGTDWLWVQATDATGAQALGHTVVTTAPPVVAPPATSSPVVTSPPTEIIAVGGVAAIAGVSIAATPSGGNLSVFVSDSVGLLATAGGAGVTAQGQGTTSLHLTGSLAAINADLASLTCQAGTAAGSDWIWISADATTGSQGLSHTVMTFTATAGATVPVQVGLPAHTLAVADLASVVSVTLTDGLGLLSAAAAAGVTQLGQDTAHLMLHGTAAAVNADLTSLSYTPVAGLQTQNPADTLAITAFSVADVAVQPPIYLPLLGGHLDG